MGMIDDEVIHEQCMVEINSLNQQLINSQKDVTNISVEKNRLENELNSLTIQLENMQKNVSVSKKIYLIKA